MGRVAQLAGGVCVGVSDGPPFADVGARYFDVSFELSRAPVHFY